MTSATTQKAAARRHRAAELAAARSRATRRRRVAVAVAAIVVVALAVVGLVAAKVAGVGSGTDRVAAASDAAAAVVREVTQVPAATLDEVGAGTTTMPPGVIDAPDLTADGKPQVLYVGAEFCPFCAAERWPLVVALSRFGTWSGLSETESAADDVYPRTKTLSFHGATYESDLLTFTGVETSTNTRVDGRYEPLDVLSARDQRTFDTYAQPPYTTGPAGAIPFLDIGGRYALAGASFQPDVLTGKSQRQIAAALRTPENEISQAVNGSANVLTAALCEVTGGRPTQVCTASGVRSGAAALPASDGS